MNLKLAGWNDTIVAVATPQGIGAIGVIRVSGEKTIDIVNALFPSKDLHLQKSHTLHVGLLKKGIETLDEVVISLYKNPKSYTGEDVIEISCHGSAYIQNEIIRALVMSGCRMAKHGEFTQRAFLNGKLDLTQAEAVADLISSNTAASRNNAIKNIRGGFKSVLTELREKLISFSALIELELDFSQEDVEFADRSVFAALISELSYTTKQLISSFSLGNVIKNGVQVAIIGNPNAGKSTLLNILLNENRAIVSEIAGTTRDTIEEILNIDGVLFRLIDTAGIRTFTEDVIEGMGISKSFEKMREADIVLYLFDLNTFTQQELIDVEQQFKKENIKYLLVGNKHDAASDKSETFSSSNENMLFISAKHNLNIDILKKRLVDTAVGGDINTESVVVSNARHMEALEKLSEALSQVSMGIERNLSGDFLSIDIKQCLYYLGLITGEVTNEDQLDFIFNKFCIGK